MKEKVQLPEKARVILNDLLFMRGMLISADGNVSPELKNMLKKVCEIVEREFWLQVFINTRFTPEDNLKLEFEGDEVFIVRDAGDEANLQ